MRLRWPWALLGVVATASFALQVALGSNLVLIGDEWTILLERRGSSPDVFLEPHQAHLHAIPILLYKSLLAVCGASSPTPFHVVSATVNVAAAGLLFAWMRERIGEWAALLGATLILFFGASAVQLLSPFQMVFSGAIAFGLGALLALEREERRWDLVACGLLVISVLFSEIGMAFVAAAAVAVLGGPRPWVRRAYVALVPLALYAFWWLGWGVGAESQFSIRNLAAAPSYGLEAIGTAAGALAGVASASDQAPRAVGEEFVPVAAAALVALVCWRLIRRPGAVTGAIWVPLAAGATFWLLAGANALPVFREPGNARYLYPSAVFILMIVAELLRGERPGRRVLAVAAALVAISVTVNLGFLSDSYRLFFRTASEQQRGVLAAVDFAGPVDPVGIYRVTPDAFFFVDAGRYRSLAADHGSPAYDEGELESAPEAARAGADAILIQTEDVALRPSSPPGPGAAEAACRTLDAAAGGVAAASGPGRVLLAAAPGADAAVAVGRFADGAPFEVGRLRPRRPQRLEFPSDRASRPWRIALSGTGKVRVCLHGGEAGS